MIGVTPKSGIFICHQQPILMKGLINSKDKRAESSAISYRYCLVVFTLGLFLLPLMAWSQNVNLRNKSFYIDGEKFFVKGIGYEIGATPGKLPWSRTFNPALLNFDMKRIVAGGYNTIRTWSPFTAQELDVIKQYDIKIIMGIWIDPAGNFSDKTFVDGAKAIVSGVLNYSKNYGNIIAYLIMNEPQPDVIANAGYDATVTLWKEVISMIHSRHPGRPVSMANTCNGTYISPDVFDFSAYNVYIYNPVTVNYLHGYQDYIKYLYKQNSSDNPLIITEYGLSVSPSGPGSWGYGGNTLVNQQEGILHMYKSLVDGGAAGSCVFNYSDGWWKSGNEFAHNDDAEEWFGLVNYTSLTDQYGQERPVWNAVKAYQSAIITLPRSSEIYSPKVPVEIFSNDTIDRIDIVLDNKVVYQVQPVPGYLSDTLTVGVKDLKDALLVFNCYDAKNNLIKREEKSILIALNKVILPSISISIGNSDYWNTGYIDVNYEIDRPAGFTWGSQVDYVFYPHVGFSYGEKYQYTMPATGPVKFSGRGYFNSLVNVITVGAAFDVTYLSFKKRIVNQLTVSRMNKLTGISDLKLPLKQAIQIFPNPARDEFSLIFENSFTGIYCECRIFDNSGAFVSLQEYVKSGQSVNIRLLKPGIYFIRIKSSDDSEPVTLKLVKLD
jgi:hypothetical protein